MEEGFYLFQSYFENQRIKVSNNLLEKVLYDFIFHFVNKDNQHIIFRSINQTINQSNIVFIDEYKTSDEIYFIFCFDKQILIISEDNLSLLNTFFHNNKDSKVYILPTNDNKSILTTLKFKIPEFNSIQISIDDYYFQSELKSFTSRFIIKNERIKTFWSKIVPIICGYLIKKSYFNSSVDRIKNYKIFIDSTEEFDLTEKEFISIRTLDTSSTSSVELIYHIKKEKLFVLKKSTNRDFNLKLFEREHHNYLNLHHPFLLKCYGIVKNDSFCGIILEFIEGKTLNFYRKMNLKIEEKMKFAFELMITIQYLHNNHFIYRDLKPDNMMIDQNNVAILIDLDRMILNSNDDQNENMTKSLSHDFLSPEICEGKPFSYSTDIYSIGKIMNFLFNEEFKTMNSYSNDLQLLVKRCIENDPKKRPVISELIDLFYINFYGKISNNGLETITIQSIEDIHSDDYLKYWVFIAENKNVVSQRKLGKMHEKGTSIPEDISKAIYYYSLASDQNDAYSQTSLGLIYGYNNDASKSIHYLTLASNQNYSDAQFYLGVIYTEGEFTQRNMNKALHYLTLAANQNNYKAQTNLGLLYSKGYLIPPDPKKAFYYFSLAAEQDGAEAQYCVGCFYSEGKYVKQDINKAIYYFTKAALKNHLYAQLNLSTIYEQGQFVKRDVDKAIYFCTLAALQDFPPALHNLATYYLRGEDVPRDVNKAIQTYFLAAEQNYLPSLMILGPLYEQGEIVEPDINKAIYYYSLAADQNDLSAQLKLGEIYMSNKYNVKNVNKAIYYYSLASSQNNAQANFSLGEIYYEGKLVSRDTNKFLHYLTLASNQNHPAAQYLLGTIYFNGQYVERDIEKAIHYLSLAANQNYSEAQFCLGSIYQYIDINKAIHYLSLAAKQDHSFALTSLGILEKNIDKSIQYFTRAANLNNPFAQFLLGEIYGTKNSAFFDTSKSIYYLTLSANQNDDRAQLRLGAIYLNGDFVARDVNRAIHYLSLASDQNNSTAQIDLGILYYSGQYIEKDIDKAIMYFSLVANLKNKVAQYNLGWIYEQGKNGTVDMEKAIHYYSLSANQNYSLALVNLGIIYLKGENVNQDINKAIHYFKLASNQNSPGAQFNLGIIYERGHFIKQDINKSIFYFSLAANQDYRKAQYVLAVFYHQGKYVQRDVSKAIHYYKELSSLNSQHAKNNLAIIYKNGFETKKSIPYAIELFNEAIRQNEDELALYNLARIYLYGDGVGVDVDKSIYLSFKSMKKNIVSRILLILALIKKTESVTLNKIKEILCQFTDDYDEISSDIYEQIKEDNLEDHSIYEYYFELFQNLDYFYDCYKCYISSFNFFSTKQNQKQKETKKLIDINDQFYQGFGIQL